MIQYNQKVAAHYAAYRPPLHQIILEKMISGEKVFSTGLDIGCGTGYSTLALTKYCLHVYGIDPSQSMLDKAAEHRKITYLKGTAGNIPLGENSVDLITLSGSLFYADIKATSLEIQRICKRDATIIVYDFELLLDEVLDMFNISLHNSDAEYDHTINFSGVDSFRETLSKQEQVDFELTGTQLAHVLLSDHRRYKEFTGKYSAKHIFTKLKEALVKSGNHFFVEANLFYSKYKLSG